MHVTTVQLLLHEHPYGSKEASGFLSSPFITRAPVFLLHGFDKGIQNDEKVQKGTTGESVVYKIS